jgi:two-component system sensor histidine kinase KdpD
VLVSAYLLGSGPAYFAAGLAFLIYDFYLVEPRFTLTFSTSDLITLLAFLGVAMLTGRLTGQVKDQARRAEARARTTSTLFAATRAFSSASDEPFIRAQLAEHLATAVKGEAFVQGAGLTVSRPADLTPDAGLAEAALRLEQAAPAAAVESVRFGEWTLRPLGAGEAALGVVGWRSRRQAEADRELVEILADVGAAAIARARLAAAKAEAEARARTEDLRNALLSSISHDLRTPLAAIMASASSLSEFGESFDAATRKDLATTIQQETERLDSFVANLLNMTRLESGALTVRSVAFSVPEILAHVVERRPAGARRVELVVAADLPEALGDPVLFEQAFRNVFENALRYTPDDGPVWIAARRADGGIEVSVTDAGPGLPAADLPRIFEKFFRSAVTARKPGTGLGLSITRGLVEGMGGAVAARARPDGEPGLVVVLAIPAAP